MIKMGVIEWARRWEWLDDTFEGGCVFVWWHWHIEKEEGVGGYKFYARPIEEQSPIKATIREVNKMETGMGYVSPKRLTKESGIKTKDKLGIEDMGEAKNADTRTQGYGNSILEGIVNAFYYIKERGEQAIPHEEKSPYLIVESEHPSRATLLTIVGEENLGVQDIIEMPPSPIAGNHKQYKQFVAEAKGKVLAIYQELAGNRREDADKEWDKFYDREHLTGLGFEKAVEELTGAITNLNNLVNIRAVWQPAELYETLRTGVAEADKILNRDEERIQSLKKCLNENASMKTMTGPYAFQLDPTIISKVLVAQYGMGPTTVETNPT